ncbi:Holliday junction resolvase RecU [Caloranaerobacter azorensis]|uniref:Holliday junction resolvase RecU n=1 Tax=Caloranaerobacter azorensis TaxID=116090 RepID=A0A6P1YDL0_9FIRM|nr:Holliday junction resolvase RecU [Caloranaerobacter azorensis]QIB26076.1 Holliday junction resolvase RecU [Caloranaerobacter azorensis]
MAWASTYSNRGKLLEQIIEVANRQYRNKGIAEIQKIATPVKVLRTDKNGKIYGFWEKKSTVDFIGVCNGIPIAFDAKETTGKSLKFDNIHKHQIEFMTNWQQRGGQAFLVVYFSELNRYFRLSILELLQYMKNPLKSNKKSIPIKYFEEYAIELKTGQVFVLDYLKGLRK